MDFLPINLKEAKALGYDYVDVIIISGDAYVDHPSFAPAIIGRFLQSLGLKVGIIPQPDWKNPDDFKVLGQPRLFFGITAGNLDSMVSLYTAQRKIRSNDLYSEAGVTGKRPYLPSIVYTNCIKQIYKGIPVILGGVEASLRRIAHYDFYSDKVRPSILLDAKADLLVYGNGEAPLKEIVNFLKKGEAFKEIKNVKGTVIPIKHNEKELIQNVVKLPSFEEVKSDKNKFLEMTKIIFDNLNPYNSKTLYQDSGSQGILINPPALPLSTPELDNIYNLPFTRLPHPSYKKFVPALKTVETSITSHRGCYGGCYFCSIYFHQGKFIQNRSSASIKKEIATLAHIKKKKIVLTDLGGPTANMYGTKCKDEKIKKACTRHSCLYPQICVNLQTSMQPYLSLLEQVGKDANVKNVFINSGIRMDLALCDIRFIEALAKYYTQGQLSTAPEHVSEKILKLMNKPSIHIYEKFKNLFQQTSKQAGKKQYIVPYFIIGYPGAEDKTEHELMNYFSENRIYSEQLQEFYPLPMTIAAAFYYTEKDLFSGKPLKVEKKLSMKKQWKKNIIDNGKEKKISNIGQGKTLLREK